MRGQISNEFMIVFVITLVFLSALLGALMIFKNKSDSLSSDVKARIRGEEGACMAGVVLNSGDAYSYSNEFGFWLENERLVYEINGRVYAVEGIFENDKVGEPV